MRRRGFCRNETFGILACAVLAWATLPVSAFDAREIGNLTVQPSLNIRLGLQHGDGINFGLGALDAIGETERTVLSLAFIPKLDLSLALDASTFYGAVSGVAATTTLDGELSGQIVRSGDQAFDTDHAYFGWRNHLIDLSLGGQEFWVGDGFIIGDGNFNKGEENGQYWIGAFQSWRNSSVVKINTEPVRADIFWLRTDGDLGDSRVVGISLETTTAETFGTLGFMYLEVLQGDAFNLDGIEAWNLRASAIKIPGNENLKFYGEWVLEVGTDDDGGGRDNDAIGWYVEGQYSFPGLPWTPKLIYRYIRLSGDEADTPENEEYRGLFYTIFKRDWDTWFQGEIAGEYHLFNQNQVTQMFKIKSFPHSQWAVTFYYYHHDLEEPHYFGTAVTDTDWAEEINFGIEHFRGDRFYGYAGIAWSTPHTAAKEIFGNDDFIVIQTFISFTF